MDMKDCDNCGGEHPDLPPSPLGNCDRCDQDEAMATILGWDDTADEYTTGNLCVSCALAFMAPMVLQATDRMLATLDQVHGPEHAGRTVAAIHYGISHKGIGDLINIPEQALLAIAESAAGVEDGDLATRASRSLGIFRA